MYGMPGKTSSDVIDSLTLFIADYATQLAPNTIYRIHSDAGTEFKSAIFKNWAAKQSIRTTYAAPEHQHQNGICERHYGIIKDIARKSWYMLGLAPPTSIMPFSMHVSSIIAYQSKVLMSNLAR